MPTGQSMFPDQYAILYYHLKGEKYIKNENKVVIKRFLEKGRICFECVKILQIDSMGKRIRNLNRKDWSKVHKGQY